MKRSIKITFTLLVCLMSLCLNVNAQLMGFIGIEVQDIPTGVLVIGITDGSPAARDGLLPEDIIIQVNGYPVYNTMVFQQHIQGHPNMQMLLTIIRGGQPFQGIVTIGSVPIEQRIQTPQIQSPAPTNMNESSLSGNIPIYEVTDRGLVAVWNGIWSYTGTCWQKSVLNKQWLLEHEHTLLEYTPCINVCTLGLQCISPSANSSEGFCDDLCTREAYTGIEEMMKIGCGCH